MNQLLATVSALALAAAFVVVSKLREKRRRNPQGLPYFPGPKPLPIIGNVLDFPRSNEWKQAREWSKVYGDKVFCDVFGRTMLFLHNYDDAVELFEKRSAIYSSRPNFVMMNEMQGWDWLASNMPYGETLRRYRQYLHRFLQPQEVHKYMPLQMQITHTMLGALLHRPEAFYDHVRWSAGALIMMLTYGHTASVEDDPFIALAERSIKMLGKVAAPGGFLVDIFPWLRYVPEWFPGAGWKAVVREGKALSENMKWTPYQLTKAEVLKGTARQSITSELIEQNTKASGEIEDEIGIAEATGVVYVAGSDTTVGTLLTFVLAMVQHPEILAKAHVELDRVVGTDRLPTFEDQESLPYVNAIACECMRWGPVTPLGAPHMLTADDIYEGHFIPAGTMCFGNQWAMLRDPAMYPDPEAFNVERWLPVSGTDVPRHPLKVSFGFGRRICPGRYLAMNSIFINIACMLAAFELKKAVREDGTPIEPRVEYVASVISHLAPFECVISPRSPQSADLVRQAAAASAWA